VHIPDGYLSPASCAALWATAAPFWAAALRRVRRHLHTRAVPLLALFAAFAFVVMLFNLPLPGGTSGHAVGVGIAGAVLGPMAAILALSVALLVQALLFGDGGLTTYGANAFNMAIVGTLVAYGVYRLLARGAALDAPRRALAAGLGGYLGVNAAGLLTAVELGLQPLLFHDAAGAPLYAPYPLRIAVPAVALGHLTVAGIAELVLTVGVVRYLQRAHPQLLETASDVAAPATRVTRVPRPRRSCPAAVLRPLWTALAVLLVATPLGLLAAGTAWGEWHASDFADPMARAQIAAASLGAAPPVATPRGLARLSTLWTAPLAGYAPTFLRSATAGYLLSAAFGVGAILLAVPALRVLLARSGRADAERGGTRRVAAEERRAA
jgi:cobalt/nickel transport system permease protein